MNICVTGGGGYVGSSLVPELLKKGHKVTVLDLFWFWREPFKNIIDNKNLNLINGDIRDPDFLNLAFRGQDAVIHLACISNDPGFDLNPELGKSINYDAFADIMVAIREHKVRRFIYASSSSVYGVRKEKNVHEETECSPLTDYSKYKLLCEEALKNWNLDTCWTIVRPATVCGFSQRLRLDLSVNILTISALVNNKINVFGGNQLRPNLNIKDMVDAYATLLEAPTDKINRQTYNVGYENKSILEIAELVKLSMQDKKIEINVTDSNDNRSYHINADKIARDLGFYPKHSITNAINTIKTVYEFGFLSKPLENSYYYNIARMKELGLS